MRKTSWKIVAFAFAGIFAMAFAGCGNKEKSGSNSEKTATESDAALNTDGAGDETSASGTDAAANDKTMDVGHIEDDNTYVNDVFGFQIKLKNSKWEFATSDKIASATGVSKNSIEKLWKGELSPYTQSVSYCAVAMNESAGANVIVGYFCPEAYGMDATTTAKEYLTAAKEGYENSVLSTEELAGISFSCLKLESQNGVSQKMYCTDKDGIILMLTITSTEDEDGESMITAID